MMTITRFGDLHFDDTITALSAAHGKSYDPTWAFNLVTAADDAKGGFDALKRGTQQGTTPGLDVFVKSRLSQTALTSGTHERVPLTVDIMAGDDKVGMFSDEIALNPSATDAVQLMYRILGKCVSAGGKHLALLLQKDLGS